MGHASTTYDEYDCDRCGCEETGPPGGGMPKGWGHIQFRHQTGYLSADLCGNCVTQIYAALKPEFESMGDRK